MSIVHSFLVIGQSTEKRQEVIDQLLSKHSVTPTNLLKFSPQGTSIGIETVREIIRHLTIKTRRVGETRAVVVEEAHLMTAEAQNAILKTLEAPPPDTIMFLSATTDDAFFATVRSRCILIPTPPKEPSISKEELEEQEKLWKRLTVAGIGERIKFVEEVGKTRETAIAFIGDQLRFLHYLIQTGKLNGTRTLLIRALLGAGRDLRANVNPKMVLFELLKNY